MVISASIEKSSPTDGAPELRPVRTTFRAVVVTLVPEASRLDPAAWDELEAIVQRSIAGRPPALRRRLRLFLRILRWMPVARYGRTFTALDPRRRARVLAHLEDHPLRIVRVGFWGLRALAFMGYYGRRQAAEEIGYRAHPDGWTATAR